MLNYLEKEKPVYKQYSASERRQQKKTIKSKRGKKKASALLLQDNAPVHTVAKAANCGFELLLHRIYSPSIRFLPVSKT